MTKKAEPKEYTFVTVQQIAETIEPEQLGNFIEDFELWLKIMIGSRKVFNANVIRPVTEFFKWIDDGKHEVNTRIFTEDQIEKEKNNV